MNRVTCGMVSSALVLLHGLLPILVVQVGGVTQLTLHLPSEYTSLPDGELRVDYTPPVGDPSPNFTFPATDSVEGVPIDDVLPGTDYTFHLYLSNSTVSNHKLWTTVIGTEPEPPWNLSIKVDTGKVAHVYWEPPRVGKATGYRLAIQPLSETDEASDRSIHLGDENLPYTLRDLTPGGTYQLHLFSIHKSKESLQSASANFTTKPNAPGRFIVWFRNETTLLVLWQPPYPSGIFDQYLVSIVPEDASQSILYVDKEGEPPGPAQAPFYGLVPGRAYNISVQTISQTQISAPTEAQYRTVPLPPSNVTFNRDKVSSRSFEVSWSPPKSFSEFDRYQVALSIRHSLRQIVGKDEERVATFDQDMEPGHTYEVTVKTVSGNVASWPVMGNITTLPLPVEEINATYGDAGEILVRWKPNNASLQDSYTVRTIFFCESCFSL